MKTIKITPNLARIQFDSMEEWLVNRKGIGGSDASAILGLNPYKTNQELWMEKKGQMSPVDISGKSYVKYGNDAEPLLRALFALDYPEYKVEYYDNNMIINKKYPWAHASLDGELMDPDGRRGILEIKTTNILQSIQWEKWDNRIPDNYYIQVLHYLLVTEYDFVVLKAQLKSVRDGEVRLTTKHYYIEREETEVVVEEVDKVMKNDELTDKQRLFCIYYVKCFNATKAYQKAYGCSYETANVEGYKTLVKPSIKTEIRNLKQTRLNREFLSEEDIFQMYIDIAFYQDELLLQNR